MLPHLAIIGFCDDNYTSTDTCMGCFYSATNSAVSVHY